MTAWDTRTILRGFWGALLGLAVVWLITAASDEGQLDAGVRAGRTFPVAPLCSAVGAALALGTARVRAEALTLEMAGRSPERTAWIAAVGAWGPSLAVAAWIALGHGDVQGYYPAPPRADVFVRGETGFASPTLGVVVHDDGTIDALDPVERTDDLPRGARGAASLATALAGLALAVSAARTAVNVRRRGARTLVEIVACAFLTLVAFQAAAAHISPAALAVAPAAILLVSASLPSGPTGGRRSAEVRS